jgi:hypothetical protein
MSSGEEFYMLENVSIHTSFENEQEQVFADVDEDDDSDATILVRPEGGEPVLHNIFTEGDAQKFIQVSCTSGLMSRLVLIGSRGRSLESRIT